MVGDLFVELNNLALVVAHLLHLDLHLGLLLVHALQFDLKKFLLALLMLYGLKLLQQIGVYSLHHLGFFWLTLVSLRNLGLLFFQLEIQLRDLRLQLKDLLFEGLWLRHLGLFRFLDFNGHLLNFELELTPLLLELLWVARCLLFLETSVELFDLGGVLGDLLFVTGDFLREGLDGHLMFMDLNLLVL